MCIQLQAPKNHELHESSTTGVQQKQQENHQMIPTFKCCHIQAPKNHQLHESSTTGSPASSADAQRQY
jgi:hypothetical protein